MRTTPNTSVEYHASVYHDLDADTTARNRAARTELPCSWCGTDFGMCGGWTREAMKPPALFSEYLSLFHLESDDHQLFYPCFQCNPDNIIPSDFASLTQEQVAAWLARECACSDCVRERGDQ